MNQLILGDNLEIMKRMDSESIDLIYLDPPFFSNRNYEVIWGDKGEIRSFEDRWSGGIDHYISWLKERVEEMHRLLKPTGSIFLHCDWHAFAEIKVMILDRIFGNINFRNLITWKRADTHNDAKKQFPIVSDYIFFYSKTEGRANFCFNKQYTTHADRTLHDWYQYLEYPDGTIRKMSAEERKTQEIPPNVRRFNADNMASPNPRPNLMYEYKGYSYPAKGWRYSLETMEKLDLEGKLLFPSNPNGRIMLKRYLDEQNGAVVGDVWLDVDQIRAAHKERIGYPTQKPEALLERIINCASNEGDVVMDPFVGGGTTVVVADRLKRNWIGIDQSVQAVKVTEMRLKNLHGKAVGQMEDLFASTYSVTLHKYDYDTLRNKNAFEFESWIVQQYGGVSNKVQRGDMGMDGKTREGKPIQVKRSDNIGRNVVDNFLSACRRFDLNLFNKNVQERSSIGTIIAFSFGKGAVQEVARLKNEDGIIIDLVKVEDIVPIAKKPKLTVTLNDLGVDAKGCREIELKAVGESEIGIEFYAWDWDYVDKFNPEVLLDKVGVQVRKFKHGSHSIAVKVIDNEGLEALEIIKLKVNGGVERG